MTNPLIRYSGVAALAVALFVLLGGPSLFSSSPSSGANQTGEVVTNKQWYTNGLAAGSTQQFLVTASGVLGSVFQLLGGTTAATSLQCTGSVGTVALSGTATASSTLFDVANPLAATSTAEVFIPNGKGQATTTLLSIGTTTQASGLALSNVSASLASSVSAATTTQFSLLSGVTSPLGTGQVSAGSGTILRVMVGPSERIGAFGTSTATGAGAANYSPGLAGGTYKIRWCN